MQTSPSEGPDLSLNRWRKFQRFLLNRSSSAPEGCGQLLVEFLKERDCGFLVTSNVSVVDFPCYHLCAFEQYPIEKVSP